MTEKDDVFEFQELKKKGYFFRDGKEDTQSFPWTIYKEVPGNNKTFPVNGKKKSLSFQCESGFYEKIKVYCCKTSLDL